MGNLCCVCCAFSAKPVIHDLCSVPLHKSDPALLRGPASFQFLRQLRAEIAERIGLGYQPGVRKRGRTDEENTRIDREFGKELRKRGFVLEEEIPTLTEDVHVRKRRNADLEMQADAKHLKLDGDARVDGSVVKGVTRRVSRRLQVLEDVSNAA